MTAQQQHHILLVFCLGLGIDGQHHRTFKCCLIRFHRFFTTCVTLESYSSGQWLKHERLLLHALRYDGIVVWNAWHSARAPCHNSQASMDMCLKNEHEGYESAGSSIYLYIY